MTPAACVLARLWNSQVCYVQRGLLAMLSEPSRGLGSFCRDTKGRHWGSHPGTAHHSPLSAPTGVDVVFISGYRVFQRLQVPRNPHYIAGDWHGCVSRSGCSPGTPGIAPPWSAGIGLLPRISACGKVHRALLTSLPCSSTERRLGPITVEKGVRFRSNVQTYLVGCNVACLPRLALKAALLLLWGCLPGTTSV